MCRLNGCTGSSSGSAPPPRLGNFGSRLTGRLAASKASGQRAVPGSVATGLMDGSVVAALAGVGMGFIACTATCVVCRVFRRTRYYKKVQHSLEEEERAFQARLAMKHGGDESSLDPADQERLEMVENYLTSIGGECGIGQDGTDASTDPHMPKGVDDVDAFMKELVRPPHPPKPDPHGCPSAHNSLCECRALTVCLRLRPCCAGSRGVGQSCADPCVVTAGCESGIALILACTAGGSAAP